MNRYIEEANYRCDHRVRAAERWYTSLDNQRMRATVQLDGGEREVAVRFEVCGTCRGKGTHVNPSIDAGGLTAQDFHSQPGLFEEYMQGAFDVPCCGCDGRRVVPVCCDEEVNALLDAQAEEDAELEAMYEAERRMGA